MTNSSQYTKAPPEDIKPGWLSIARRMQSSLSGNKGAAIVTMRIIVDENSVPSMWVAPTITLLEPKSKSAAILAFIKHLTGES